VKASNTSTRISNTITRANTLIESYYSQGSFLEQSSTPPTNHLSSLLGSNSNVLCPNITEGLEELPFTGGDREKEDSDIEIIAPELILFKDLTRLHTDMARDDHS
jgi:hypothetical protein